MEAGVAEAYVEGQGRHHHRASCVLGSPEWKAFAEGS